MLGLWPQGLWWGWAVAFAVVRVGVLCGGLEFTFLVIFHVQIAQRERYGALYCVVLFALRRFVSGWGGGRN